MFSKPLLSMYLYAIQNRENNTTTTTRKMKVYYPVKRKYILEKWITQKVYTDQPMKTVTERQRSRSDQEKYNRIFGIDYFIDVSDFHN